MSLIGTGGYGILQAISVLCNMMVVKEVDHSSCKMYTRSETVQLSGKMLQNYKKALPQFEIHKQNVLSIERESCTELTSWLVFSSLNVTFFPNLATLCWVVISKTLSNFFNDCGQLLRITHNFFHYILFKILNYSIPLVHRGFQAFLYINYFFISH